MTNTGAYFNPELDTYEVINTKIQGTSSVPAEIRHLTDDRTQNITILHQQIGVLRGTRVWMSKSIKNRTITFEIIQHLNRLNLARKSSDRETISLEYFMLQDLNEKYEKLIV